jgi:RHS repeat-associated protein
MSDAAGAQAWSFDVGGRVVADRRTTNGVTKAFNYTYNLIGGLATLSYPSGRMITYTYNDAGRLFTGKDVSGGVNYATGPCAGTGGPGACYEPHGALQSMTYGKAAGYNGIDFTGVSNNRLQPGSMIASTPGGQVMNLSYDFVDANGNNNGNLDQVINLLNSARTVSYTYDELNRLKRATTQATSGGQCFGIEHGYDIWANLLTITQLASHPSCTGTLSQSVGTNNRVSGISFDAAGNQTSDGPYTMTWDAESKMKSHANVNYTYDGDGRRVKKDQTNGSAYDKLYWYGLGGDVLAESDFAGTISDEFIFFGGKRIARQAGSNVFYYLADHLGTSRAMVQGGQNTPCYDADFEPFGREKVVTNACPQNYKFTSHERDSESSFDYMKARYYGSGFGRFASPDPYMPSASLADPQSWNRYTYARNNPLLYIDPNGLDYKHLTGKQKDLIDEWAAKQNELEGVDMSAEERYNGLDESERATYEAVTHALMNTALTDANGNVVGNALDLVASVDSIAGEVEGKGGDKQFRVYFTLKEGAAEILQSAQGFARGKNRVHHEGFPDSFRQGRNPLRKGKRAGLQVSVSADGNRSDVDVDYRFLTHLTVDNSDVRAEGNYQRHIDRWPGLVKWWDDKKN